MGLISGLCTGKGIEICKIVTYPTLVDISADCFDRKLVAIALFEFCYRYKKWLLIVFSNEKL